MTKSNGYKQKNLTESLSIWFKKHKFTIAGLLLGGILGSGVFAVVVVFSTITLPTIAFFGAIASVCLGLSAYCSLYESNPYEGSSRAARDDMIHNDVSDGIESTKQGQLLFLVGCYFGLCSWIIPPAGLIICGICAAVYGCMIGRQLGSLMDSSTAKKMPAEVPKNNNSEEKITSSPQNPPHYGSPMQQNQSQYNDPNNLDHQNLIFRR